ncbi:MAG: hypothetical protein LBV28_01335 [Puniceicoccales bacterium]|jgi:hypothetical protein|nr:hypothetical protein [Puniceicoccales bacterium]
MLFLLTLRFGGLAVAAICMVFASRRPTIGAVVFYCLMALLCLVAHVAADFFWSDMLSLEDGSSGDKTFGIRTHNESFVIFALWLAWAAIVIGRWRFKDFAAKEQRPV